MYEEDDLFSYSSIQLSQRYGGDILDIEMMNAPRTPANRRSMRLSSARGSVGRDSEPSEPVWNTPASTRKVQHVAVPVPDSENLHHAHPTSILQRLLEDISEPSSRHFDRYGEFVFTGGDELVQLLHRCVRKELWDLVGQTWSTSHPSEARPSVEALSLVGGDTTFYGRAIYLHILAFPENITRLYVGQAFNLAARVKNQHSDWRYRRDHPSLHNFAMDRSISDQYVVLAVIREACERTDLVLNLLEMWMALWLGTLPDEVMQAWLGSLPPEDAMSTTDSGKIFGLNVAEPLDQGDQEAWKSSFGTLKNSSDEMATDYFSDVKKRPRPVKAAVKDTKTVVEIVAERAWLQYIPHLFGILTFGFVLGRWSSGLWRRK